MYHKIFKLSIKTCKIFKNNSKKKTLEKFSQINSGIAFNFLEKLLENIEISQILEVKL